jgi:hypothetical protein
MSTTHENAPRTPDANVAFTLPEDPDDTFTEITPLAPLSRSRNDPDDFCASFFRRYRLCARERRGLTE